MTNRTDSEGRPLSYETRQLMERLERLERENLAVAKASDNEILKQTFDSVNYDRGQNCWFCDVIYRGTMKDYKDPKVEGFICEYMDRKVAGIVDAFEISYWVTKS